MEAMPEYDPDHVQVLRTAEHIRRRPELYVGYLPNPAVFNRLVEESLCLSVDEAACGNCTEIAVAVHQTGAVTIRDNAPGLSMEPGPDGWLLAELLLTQVGACRGQAERDHHIFLLQSRLGGCQQPQRVAAGSDLSRWELLAARLPRRSGTSSVLPGGCGKRDGSGIVVLP